MSHTRGGTYSVSLFPTAFVAAFGGFPLATSGPSTGRVVMRESGDSAVAIRVCPRFRSRRSHTRVVLISLA